MGNRMWTGDLEDDCFLKRYGFKAHVECMDKGHWWFSVGRGDFPNYQELYNSANMMIRIRLTTGDMARSAAEHLIEYLRQNYQNQDSA